MAEKSFYLTFIVNGPSVKLGSFASILHGLYGVLEEIEKSLHGNSIVNWTVGEIIPGHSEYSDIQRIAIEIKGETSQAVGDDYISGIVDQTFAFLEKLRSILKPDVEPEGRLLQCCLELAGVLGCDIAEMWLSITFGPQVYITPNTLSNLNALG